MPNHIYIFLTIFFTVYGQMIIKWQVSLVGAMPEELLLKIQFLLRLIIKPWVLSGYASALLASIAWMAAMSKFQLSYAYPFMSLAFVLVLFLSSIFFYEAITMPKVIGMAFIVLGIIVGSQK
jgi:multidrug transporter EmrE-like cation transporter